ncbi:hypothetical protein AB0J57_32770 [Streptomyces sp. NPDC049837]
MCSASMAIGSITGHHRGCAHAMRLRRGPGALTGPGNHACRR